MRFSDATGPDKRTRMGKAGPGGRAERRQIEITIDTKAAEFTRNSNGEAVPPSLPGSRPVKVNGFSDPFDFADRSKTHHMGRTDTAAVLKSLHVGPRGHGNYVPIHGNQGVTENTCHGDVQRLRIWREPWEEIKGEPVDSVYKPDFPTTTTGPPAPAMAAAIFSPVTILPSGQQPYLDVYGCIDMSISGIETWRSGHNDSAPMEIPETRRESVHLKYAKDDWSRDRARQKSGQTASSMFGELEPLHEATQFGPRRDISATDAETGHPSPLPLIAA